MAKRHSKKPRMEAIIGTTAGEVTEVSVSYNPGTGEFSFGSEMTNVRHEVSYERKKGDKILTKTQLSGGRLHIDANNALLKNFTSLIAIDTNTEEISGVRVSVTGVAVCQPFSRSHNRLFPDVPFCIEFTNACVPPEKLGWLNGLTELQSRRALRTAGQVGLIVDAHLGEMEDINKRAIPIFGSVFLPKGFTLVYASADAGMENLANQILKLADSTSTQVLSKLERGEIPSAQPRFPGSRFQSRRVIPINATFIR